MNPDLPRPGAPGKPDQKRRRQMLIYGGVAGVILLMLLLSRRGAAAQAPADDGTQQSRLVPVAGGASDGTTAGFDNAAQLASFENSLLGQLPQAISQGLAAGFANIPGAGSPAAAENGVAPSSAADLITAIGNNNAAMLGIFSTLRPGAAAVTQPTAKATGKKPTTASKPKPQPTTSGKKTDLIDGSTGKPRPTGGITHTDVHPVKAPAKAPAKANVPTGRATKRHG